MQANPQISQKYLAIQMLVSSITFIQCQVTSYFVDLGVILNAANVILVFIHAGIVSEEPSFGVILHTGVYVFIK